MKSCCSAIAEELITADTDLVALRRQAYKEGTRNLRLSGAQKVAAGISTLEEVLRVTRRANRSSGTSRRRSSDGCSTTPDGPARPTTPGCRR
ncbi:hypothetical protein P4123_25720 [Pseudomonas aeruginosa]|nr:hypothetical protein [Pseudomonas aeruginosa]